MLTDFVFIHKAITPIIELPIRQLKPLKYTALQRLFLSILSPR